MIFVDGEKYACAQCIRGHRSSSCKHTTRPLLMCRSRGRPSLNAGHRIAVTEIINTEESSLPTPSSSSSLTSESSFPMIKQEASPESSCCSSRKPLEEIVPKPSCCSKSKAPEVPSQKSCCSKSTEVEPLRKGKDCACTAGTCKCSSGNPILLKAAKRSFVDFKGGNLKFMGPYQENSLNNFKVGYTESGIKKPRHNPGPCCPSRKQQHHPKQQHNSNGQLLSELAIFKTLVLNEVDINDDLPKYIPIQPKQEPTNTPSTEAQQPMNILSYPQPLNPNSSTSSLNDFQGLTISGLGPEKLQFTPQTYDMLLASGCTVECNCGPSCGCETCLVHRTNEELKKVGLIFQSVSTPSDTRVSENGDREYTPEPTPDLGNSINFEVTDELFMDDCQCPDDACACDNCIKHNIIGGVKFPQGVPTQSSDFNGLAKDLGLAEFDLPQSLISASHDCGCSASECQCFTCEKHGIINGVRVNSEFLNQ